MAKVVSSNFTLITNCSAAGYFAVVGEVTIDVSHISGNIVRGCYFY